MDVIHGIDRDKELETYRAAIPAIVEDFAAQQRELRDEKTVCEFWKRACERSLDLADGYAVTAYALRDRALRVLKLARDFLDESSKMQTERLACAEIDAFLVELESQ